MASRIGQIGKEKSPNRDGKPLDRKAHRATDVKPDTGVELSDTGTMDAKLREGQKVKVPTEEQDKDPGISVERMNNVEITRKEPQGSTEYDMPDNYDHLNELATPSAVENTHEVPLYRHLSLEETKGEQARRKRDQRSYHIPTSETPRRDTEYDLPEMYGNLDELAAPSPVGNIHEGPVYQHLSLEQVKSNVQDDESAADGKNDQITVPGDGVSKGAATQLYVVSYLILFSFLGTLARLGLQAITFYPGAPLIFSQLWANFGGSLFMGFLSEDRMLFREEWGTPTYDQLVKKVKAQAKGEELSSASGQSLDLQTAKRSYAATKRTIPLYIGLTTGFCGCFTSFSSFIRDTFLALSNNLSTPLNHPEDYSPVVASPMSTVPRNGGYSFMALLAVIITTTSMCIAALYLGAHIALLLEPITPSLPFRSCRKVLDPAAAFLAWGCWIGAIFLAIFPPDRHDGSSEIWRGRAVFALVFAPIGCLGRFYLSIYLNGKILSFPLGTFTANVFGTVILGMAYDLQRADIGGVVGCQVVQGIEDGFCGCLTTVSTWVSELSTLRRRNAYRYGAASVVVALCFLIVIMGSMRWTRGFSDLKCTH